MLLLLLLLLHDAVLWEAMLAVTSPPAAMVLLLSPARERFRTGGVKPRGRGSMLLPPVAPPAMRAGAWRATLPLMLVLVLVLVLLLLLVLLLPCDLETAGLARDLSTGMRDFKPDPNRFTVFGGKGAVSLLAGAADVIVTSSSSLHSPLLVVLAVLELLLKSAHGAAKDVVRASNVAKREARSALPLPSTGSSKPKLRRRVRWALSLIGFVLAAAGLIMAGVLRVRSVPKERRRLPAAGPPPPASAVPHSPGVQSPANDLRRLGWFSPPQGVPCSRISSPLPLPQKEPRRVGVLGLRSVPNERRRFCAAFLPSPEEESI